MIKKKIAILALSALVTGGALVGCGNKKQVVAPTTKSSVQTATSKAAAPTPTTEKCNSDSSSCSQPSSKSNNKTQIKEMYIQKENEVIKKNESIWNKIFSKVNKEQASKFMDNGGSYYNYLKMSYQKSAKTLNANEKKLVQMDLKKIKILEKAISDLKDKK